MAIRLSVLKESYKSYTIEQLEEKLNYIYNVRLDKNKFIKVLVDEFMNVNYFYTESSSEFVCIELLKEKTGKDYTISSEEFYELKSSYKSRKEHAKRLGIDINKNSELLIDFDDVLNYILETFQDPFWKKKLKDFFKEVKVKNDEEKLFFLLSLYHNKEEINNFSKELANKYNSKEIFNSYYKKCEEFYHHNKIIA